MLLEGLQLPLTTPFYSDGRLNLRKLEHNVARYSKTPVAGLVALGATGEPTLLHFRATGRERDDAIAACQTSLKLAPNREMATRALLVDRRRFARHQAHRSVGVNLVTGGAGNLIARMAALQAADMSRLIQVAGQTDLVSRPRRQFRGITNVLG